MSYDEMPAGPEMDRLIAEKVMGFVKSEHGTYWKGSGGQGWEWEVNSWHPSTNIAHAWEVVDHIKILVGDFQHGDGWLTIKYSDSADHGEGKNHCDPGEARYDDLDFNTNKWSVHLHTTDAVESTGWGRDQRFCARGETAPLAICRAALMAVAPASSMGDAP